MKLAQPNLFGDEPDEHGLTERQRAAYDHIRHTPGGATADEVGAHLHADAGKHHPDSRCDWCATTGLDVLRSKAVAPLVVKRRESGRYEPRDGTGTPLVPQSSQLAVLPDDLFGLDVIDGSEAA